MPLPSCIRLSEVVSTFAPQGANDRRWFLMEHHLVQAKLSLLGARSAAAQICILPENAAEAELADGCLEFIIHAYGELLGQHAALLAYISDSDISERVGKVEL